jgi:hypothetical protein
MFLPAALQVRQLNDIIITFLHGMMMLTSSPSCTA